MLKTTAMLLEELADYRAPRSKLSRMVKDGKYFRIKRDLYETDRSVPPHLLAGSIYGPSYISFEYALSIYGLIPERVYTVTSAVFEKKKKKQYKTVFGRFSYRDVPSEAFPLGINLIQEGDYFYWIAIPEKALCDQLYTLPPVSNTKELFQLLTEDMRIEEEELQKLNVDIIADYKNVYHSTNVNKLPTVLRRIKK